MNPNQPYGYGGPPQGPYAPPGYGAQGGYGPPQGYGAPPGYGAPQGAPAGQAHGTEDGCQRCGAQVATNRVHLRQNIGLLVTRLVSRAEGYLCKACIRDVGFRYTLMTMFFGWWGVISFFVTLYILPSNTWQIFSARNLPEVPGRPRPTGLYVVMLLLGGLIGLFTALILAATVSIILDPKEQAVGGFVIAILFQIAFGALPAGFMVYSAIRGLVAKPA